MFPNLLTYLLMWLTLIATVIPHIQSTYLPGSSQIRVWEQEFIRQQNEVDQFLAQTSTTNNQIETPPTHEPVTTTKPLSSEITPTTATAQAEVKQRRQRSIRPTRPILPPKANGKPLVTLCMIIKNERASIISTLNSVLGYVDRYSILDTGSTDGSIKMMESWFKKYLEPDQYVLHHGPFIDFSTTRNEALRLAGDTSEFILFLNGDDRLRGGAAFRSFLEERRFLRGIDEAMYIVPINYGGISMGRSERISRSSNHFVPNWPNDSYNHWRYEGVTHEVYVSQAALQGGVEMLYVPENTFEIYHDITYDTGDAKKERFELDVKLLLQELETEPDRPNRPRTIYYLAQSYYNLNDWPSAARWYKERIKINYPRPTPKDRDNEKAKSYMMLAQMSSRLGYTKKDMKKYLLAAADHCKTAYSLLQLTKFYTEIEVDHTKAKTYLRQCRQLLQPPYANPLCGDDPQLVQQLLPQLAQRLGM